MDSHQSSPVLPTIDFSIGDLQPGSDNWVHARAQVQHALVTYGCFQAIFPSVSLQMQKEILRHMKELFALPIGTKSRNSSPFPGHAYLVNPRLPLHESMGIEYSDVQENIEKITKLFWPEGNSNFSETMLSFSKIVSGLDHMVRRMILESLGLEKYYDSHIDSTMYILRLMKYKGPQTKEAKPGTTEHTDKNVVTILFPYKDGLEVQTKDGCWIQVVASPNTCVVMAGDALLAWSNGRVHSAVHRVMMTGDQDRYSIGLFSRPNNDHIIQVPEELVDEQHPLLFKPFKFGEFMNFFYATAVTAGQNTESVLTAYCGA